MKHIIALLALITLSTFALAETKTASPAATM